MLIGKLLNGIAEHCAGHRGGARGEPGGKARHISLAGLAQKPAHSLLKQLVERVRVVQENLRNSISVVQIPIAHKGHSANNAYAPLPNSLAIPGKVIQNGALFIPKIFAQQPVAAKVHKVPIVDMLGVRKIKIYALLLIFGFSPVGVQLHQG